MDPRELVRSWRNGRARLGADGGIRFAGGTRADTSQKLRRAYDWIATRALVTPYLTLMTEEAPQRDFPLREVFNGLRWIVRTGAPWRWMPHDLPLWNVVYQQSMRWIKAGVFESLVYDLCGFWRQPDNYG